MRPEAVIAFRYLFSRKKRSIINICSVVCALGVALGSLSLVCILSVYNGFADMLGEACSRVDPDLRVSSVSGRPFSFSGPVEAFSQVPGVGAYAPVLEDHALASADDRQVALFVKGVDEDYRRVVSIDSMLIEGRWMVSQGQQFCSSVLAVGLAQKLDVNIYKPQVISLMAPKRGCNPNLANPDEAFSRTGCVLSGVYAVGQDDIDSRYIFVPRPVASSLLGLDSSLCSSLEVRVRKGFRVDDVKAGLASALGPGFVIESKIEQHSDFFKMLSVEKWITYFILVLVLLTAEINVTGSLTMLIIEKRSDIFTLGALGADVAFLRRVFLIEGALVSAFGAVAGVLGGIVVCLSQIRWGFISLGGLVDGAYPVRIQFSDVLSVLFAVLLIGLVVAWIPARRGSSVQSLPTGGSGVE